MELKFICDECGSDMFAYEKKSGTYYVVPCSTCEEEQYADGQRKGYLEGRLDIGSSPYDDIDD